MHRINLDQAQWSRILDIFFNDTDTKTTSVKEWLVERFDCVGAYRTPQGHVCMKFKTQEQAVLFVLKYG